MGFIMPIPPIPPIPVNRGRLRHMRDEVRGDVGEGEHSVSSQLTTTSARPPHRRREEQLKTATDAPSSSSTLGPSRRSKAGAIAGTTVCICVCVSRVRFSAEFRNGRGKVRNSKRSHTHKTDSVSTIPPLGFSFGIRRNENPLMSSKARLLSVVPEEKGVTAPLIFVIGRMEPKGRVSSWSSGVCQKAKAAEGPYEGFAPVPRK